MTFSRAGVLDGLLLPAELGGRASAVRGTPGRHPAERQHHGAAVEARHALCEREAVVSTRGHHTQQTAEDQQAGAHPVFYEVCVTVCVCVGSVCVCVCLFVCLSL